MPGPDLLTLLFAARLAELLLVTQAFLFRHHFRAEDLFLVDPLAGLFLFPELILLAELILLFQRVLLLQLILGFHLLPGAFLLLLAQLQLFS